MRWQQEGLIEPATVSKAIKSYRNESDNVARFLEYRTDAIPDAKVPKRRLYEHYQNWIEREGEQYTASNREFSEIVSRQPHIQESRSKIARMWKGIQMKDSFQSD